MPGVVAVAADQDLDPRPVGADGLDDVAQDEGDLGAARRLAGAQDHGDRLAGARLVDVHRQKAATVVVGMEQGKLLATVDPIFGVVEVEHDPPRHVFEAVAEQLNHRRHHALERDRAGQVLEPAHGRLGAELGAALGQPADRHLEGRIGAQCIAIVGILIAGRDQQGTEAAHLGEPVLDPLGRPRIFDASRQPLGDAELALDLGQHQHPAVGGQAPGVARDLHRLAADG